MKRFRFPLRPVAILRAHQEMAAREAFAVSVNAFVKAEQALALARERLRRLEAELTSGRNGSFSAAAEIRALTAYRRECAAEGEAEKARREAQDAMQKRRLEYLEAHRKLEVVRRLEDKARRVHQYETMREEQAEFDDFASRHFAQRSLHSA